MRARSERLDALVARPGARARGSLPLVLARLLLALLDDDWARAAVDEVTERRAQERGER